MLTGKEIRTRYLEFFAKKGHLVLPSAPLVPDNDPSLLLIGAGMAPFKSYFTGQEKPPRDRIATCQKCVRTGDLENVGQTARHHTFFEMLGNFSFADYFKEEAIAWAWEFMTVELGLSSEVLWVSIYEEDDEALAIWRDQVGVPASRIVPLGKKDNFWEIGPGPCGPCSEIYIDLGPERGCGSPDCKPGCECDRFLEVWNLVFTQFNREEDGTYTPLPKKNIDTGMGLERMASVMQGVATNFDTDLIKPIIDHTAQLAGVSYGTDQRGTVSLKVIADHLRAVVYMVGDGILPSNEGRGYVLRRLLRRAVRHGKLLGLDRPFLYQVAETVIDIGRDVYGELVEKQQLILEVIKLEEVRFHETLQAGMNILADFLHKLQEQGEENLPGEQAFKLYDTYGFPLDLTKEIAAEEGFAVDEEGFAQAMESQRERARSARREADGMLVGDGMVGPLANLQATIFSGYTQLTTQSTVQGIIQGAEIVDRAQAGEEVEVVLDQTPFYAEGGGQVGDQGVLQGPQGVVTVHATRRLPGGIVVHQGTVSEGSITQGDKINATVNEGLRQATARNHTATHLLHWALREVLGSHVQQAGSQVSPERLRFDFSHYAPPTGEEMAQVEKLVNEKILAGISLEIFVTSLAEAQQLGAMALFGEKYAEDVRVVKMGDFSIELCGGTHVSTTSGLGFCKLVSEGSVGAGIRRVEAVTGAGALEYVEGLERSLNQAAQVVKTSAEELPERLGALVASLKEREREIEALKQQVARLQVGELLAKVQDVKGVPVLALPVEAKGMDDLRGLGDILKEQLPQGVILLGARTGDRVNFLCAVGKDLVQRGLHAGKIIQGVAQVAGGGGGGRPDMATAGGKDPHQLEAALDKGVDLVGQQLGC